LFGGGAETDAANANRALLAQYGPQAQGYLTTGYNTGTNNLNQAVGAYAPVSALADKYNQASNLYLGALGAGGPAGTAAAQSAFTNSPGYQQGIDAGTQAILRQMAGAGMTNSGNTAQDVGTYVQNTQNQQYNNWLTNLAGAGQTGAGLAGTAAAGQAGGYTNLANLAQGNAQNQAGVAGNVLSGNVNANNLQAAGEAAGAKNLLGAGLSLASLAMGGVGGGGLGSLLGGGGAVPGAIGPTSIGGQPLGKSPTFLGGLFG
jgi:hypothetical protein